MKIITEHGVKIRADLPKGDVNSKMQVFYNPVMVSNRNISITLLNSIKNKNMKIALPLVGSGIRSFRFLKYLKKEKLAKMFVNDLKPTFPKTFQEGLDLNNIKFDKDKISINNQEASLFLLNQEGFDYIDIDPFGTPNPFLAASIARISRDGVLAITATDTAALTGTYPKVTKRKYWAKSNKNYLMHEAGLRILIRKVQLQGVQFEKALTPILSYHKDHYFRIYFRSERGKKRCDEIIKLHQYLLQCSSCLNYKISIYNKESCQCGKEFDFSGPMWIGKLFENHLIKKMVKINEFKEDEKFLNLLLEESNKDLVGFYDIHQIAKNYKVAIPKLKPLIKKLKATRTNFSPTGFKSEKNIVDIIKTINSKK